MREIPFDRDGDFSLETFVDRYNADLANDFGNLASRVLKMLAQYTDGKVPDAGPAAGVHAELSAIAAGLGPRLEARMEALDFSGALEDIWRLVGRANKYVEESKPWELRKDEARADELNIVLYNLAETLRLLTYAAYPFIPDASERLAAQLGVRPPSSLGPQSTTLAEALRWGGLTAGHQTQVGEVLFPRLDKAAVLAAE